MYERYETFVAAQRVADLIFSYTSNEPTTPITKPFLEDRRNFAPSGSKTQTESGLFLSLKFRRPNALWTPWGNWQFAGDGAGSWEDLMPEIKNRLGVAEYQPEWVNDGILTGPVYGISCIDNREIPSPVTRSWMYLLTPEKAYQEWCDYCNYYEKATQTSLV